LDRVDDALDALDSPTTEEVYTAMRVFDVEPVVAAAAQRAINGGGGGGSLPDWWTVDSTPDAESITFGGPVYIEGSTGQSALLAIDDPDDVLTFSIGADHSVNVYDENQDPIVILTPTALSFGANSDGLPGGFQYVAGSSGFRVFLTAGQSMTVLDSNFSPIFRIDEADGSVHIKTGTTIQADL
jgi:hypothetical protein